MNDSLEKFKTERTRIISQMLDNPNGSGIFPTSEAFNALDRLFTDLCRHEAIHFAGEYSYRKFNPKSKMDIPSIVYENVENYYDKKYNQ